EESVSQAGEEESVSQAGEEDAVGSQGAVLEDARKDALDFVEGLLEAMELEGSADVQVMEGELHVAVEGEEVGLLIGRRGNTLEAVQELLRAAVRRQARERIPITLDVEGYRGRRRVVLQEQAREMALRALEEGEVELEPMPAFERKVVHDTVNDIEGVESFSEGEEPRRRVIIARKE
ncbi:MAG: protein jag, partial [Actinomycetota bacterium]